MNTSTPNTSSPDTSTPNTSTPTMNIMAHMIPYYPDLELSRSIARGMHKGGARYLEVQFAYSDPTADGPAIQGATAGALRNGFTVARGWEFVATLPQPVFVMSYAGLVYAKGIDTFVRTAAEHQVAGLIVPDLPVDADEGIYNAGARHGVTIVPVIALGAAQHRIDLVHSTGSPYIYASLRRGITGTRTTIGEENIAFLDALSARGARVLAGFGISDSEQVHAVTQHAHAAVVGSAYVRAVEDALRRDMDPGEAVREVTEALTRPPAPPGAAPSGTS